MLTSGSALLRRIIPEPVKKPLRLVRFALTPTSSSAPSLPQESLDGCKFLSNRDYMLNFLPKNSVVCEVGTLYGDFSKKIIETCAPRELHLLDIDFTPLRDDVRTHTAVKLHKGSSAQILSSFADNYFDWIYIDGDHTHKGVKADIAAAIPKLKPGGYLVFNDFARITQKKLGTFGVHQAVCEFVQEYKWKLAYFCFEVEALYDVALQKPR